MAASIQERTVLQQATPDIVEKRIVHGKGRPAGGN